MHKQARKLLALGQSRKVEKVLAIQKARTWTANVKPQKYGSQSAFVPNLAPRVFSPPPSGGQYYGAAYRWEQALHFSFWSYCAICTWIKLIAGGSPPNFGQIRAKTPAEKKRLHIHRKSLGGPLEHEEFEPYPHDHAIRRVFNNPNGPDVAYDLWAYHTLFKQLMGISYWWVIRNAYNVPVEIWVVPPHWVTMRTGYDGTPDYYLVQSPWGYTMHIPYDEMVTFVSHSPLNRYEGYAPSLAGSTWIDVYESMTRTQLATYKNGAIPSFHVQLGESYVDPSDDLLARIYAKWFAKFQGEDNAGKPLITGPDMEIKPLGVSPDKLMFNELEESSIVKTLALYGMSKAALGLTDGMTYGSVEAALGQVFLMSVNPELHYTGQVVTEKVIKPCDEYGVCFWDERTSHDPEMVRKDISEKLASGRITYNEARALDGNQPYPHGGDNPMVNGQEMPWVKEVPKDQQEAKEVEQAFGRAYGKPVHDDGDGIMDDTFLQDAEELRDTEPDEVEKADVPAVGSRISWDQGDYTLLGIVQRVKPDGWLETRVTSSTEEDSKDIGRLYVVDPAKCQVQKTLGESSGAAGGYLVPEQRLTKYNVDPVYDREDGAWYCEVWGEPGGRQLYRTPSFKDKRDAQDKARRWVKRHPLEVAEEAVEKGWKELKENEWMDEYPDGWKLFKTKIRGALRFDAQNPAGRHYDLGFISETAAVLKFNNLRSGRKPERGRGSNLYDPRGKKAPKRQRAATVFAEVELGSLDHVTDADFAGRQPSITVDPAMLVATQEWLYPATVERYRLRPTDEPLWLVRRHDRLLLYDGHHRAAGDIANNRDGVGAVVIDMPEPPDPTPFTIAVDLDGTLAENTFPEIGDPMPGAAETMAEFHRAGYRIIVFSVRGDVEQIEDWLHLNGIPFDHINENPDQPPDSSGKVYAHAYLDDRGITFTDWTHAREAVRMEARKIGKRLIISRNGVH